MNGIINPEYLKREKQKCLDLIKNLKEDENIYLLASEKGLSFHTILINNESELKDGWYYKCVDPSLMINNESCRNCQHLFSCNIVSTVDKLCERWEFYDEGIE